MSRTVALLNYANLSQRLQKRLRRNGVSVFVPVIVDIGLEPSLLLLVKPGEPLGQVNELKPMFGGLPCQQPDKSLLVLAALIQRPLVDGPPGPIDHEYHGRTGILLRYTAKRVFHHLLYPAF